MYVYVRICMYVCMYVCMYACMYLRTYIRMYVCMHMFLDYVMCACLHGAVYPILINLYMHICTWDQNSEWEDFTMNNLNAKSMYICTGGAEDFKMASV